MKIFYRLGVTIENHTTIRRYTTFPPKDPEKWAKICEHIVAHYNDGWANGHRWNIEHWEIWNEPETETGNGCMWAGTKEQFFELYRVTANRLKRRFPGIKVGGYGAQGFYAVDQFAKTVDGRTAAGQPAGRLTVFTEWFEDFCKYVTDPKTSAPLDFFSWHIYVYGGHIPDRIATHAAYVRRTLDAHGLKSCESYLDEWNDLNGLWPPRGDKPRRWSDLKGQDAAVDVAAAFAVMQHAPMTGAMYYDGQPTGGFCGLFTFPDVDKTPVFHTFKAFGKLYRMGTAVPVELKGAPARFYAVAAKNDGGSQGVFVVNGGAAPVRARLAFAGAADLYDVTRLAAGDGDFKSAVTAKAGDEMSFPARTVTLLRARESAIPKCSFSGTPKFAWRGYMLDCARHFFTADEIKRELDAMAMFGLNVFHWHLTDSEGWRFPVDAYPELVKTTRPVWGRKRSRMKASYKDREETGTYGPYSYTKDEIRDVIAYAAARGIRIVPEIELPGHAGAAIRAYPSLACAVDEKSRTGCNHVCAASDEVLRFYERVLDEVCAIFPGEVVHIGGDECSMKNWKKCPNCQALMKREGMKDVKELQKRLTVHFAKYLEKKGKRAMGWDEIMEAGDLPKNVIVQSWRGAKAGIAAAKKGYDVVMSPVSCCYLDYDQGLQFDPKEYAAFGSIATAMRLAEFDPCKNVPPECRSHVLGAQANCWTELMYDIAGVEWRTWPRLAALADVLWNGVAADEKAFAARLENARARLQDRGIFAAPIGPLYEFPQLDPKPKKVKWLTYHHLKMLGCGLDRTCLEYDPNNLENQHRKIYVTRDAKMPSGAYRMETQWERVRVTCSDEKGEDRALAMLRKLFRTKENGVLQFPGFVIED